LAEFDDPFGAGRVEQCLTDLLSSERDLGPDRLRPCLHGIAEAGDQAILQHEGVAAMLGCFAVFVVQPEAGLLGSPGTSEVITYERASRSGDLDPLPHRGLEAAVETARAAASEMELSRKADVRTIAEPDPPS